MNHNIVLIKKMNLTGAKTSWMAIFWDPKYIKMIRQKGRPR